MQTYVAIFFSHYEATVFARALTKRGLAAKTLPVPRQVSSSCGTGVQFETAEDPASLATDGVDKMFRRDEGDYTLVYEAEG